jgi:hypothetical protein
MMDAGRLLLGLRKKTMWILIMIAVHVTNPNDQPGKVQLQFETEKSCVEALQSIQYELKFKQFRVEGKCVKQS